MSYSSTFRTAVLGLFLVCAGGGAVAQSTLSDPIARKAYSAHYDRVYLLGGGALPDYSALNRRFEGIKARFPTLKPGALLFGVGYGQGFGPLGVALEWKVTVRANDVDSSLAYTNLLTNTFSLVGRYNLFVSNRHTISILAGPTYSRLNLTLKEPQPRNSPPATFEAQVLAGGDKRKLYQSQFGLTAGVQIEQHFTWLRRNDVQACGRARQITVGLRAQYDYSVKSYRWHTERPLFRRNTRFDTDPMVNPVGFSAALVVGGLFNRY